MDAAKKKQLIQFLGEMSDDDLVALANKGLVRRAKKDLEKSETWSVTEQNDMVRVEMTDCHVDVPVSSPIEAVDSTPASGVTRQILAALLFLKAHWRPVLNDGIEPPQSETGSAADDPLRSTTPDAVTTADSETEQITPSSGIPHNSPFGPIVKQLIEVDARTIAKWAGKSPVAAANRLLKKGLEFRVECTTKLAVHFEDSQIRVVLLSSRSEKRLVDLLQHFKSNAPPEEHAKWVVAAVLALRKQSSGKMAAFEISGQENELRLEDRLRIARRTSRLLENIVGTGIAHPSSRILERLQSASITADAASFPRLSKLLTALANEIKLLLRRDAAADLSMISMRIAMTHALCCGALNQDHVEERQQIWGEYRSQYVEAGELELVGLGAAAWQTQSGYEGMTAYFFDCQEDEFRSVSLARGENVDRFFSAEAAYRTALNWDASPSVERLSRSKIHLQNGTLNSMGRLGNSEKCRVIEINEYDPNSDALEKLRISEWSELVPVFQEIQPIGLKVTDPRKALVIIKPAQWGRRWFDELEQAFYWELYDSNGEVLLARLCWLKVTEPAIQFLESTKVERDGLTAMFGRLDFSSGVVCIEPISLFSRGTPTKNDKILSPFFDVDRLETRNTTLIDRLRKKFKRQPQVMTQLGSLDDDEKTPSNLDRLPSVFRYLIAEIDDLLQTQMETGRGILMSNVQDRMVELGSELEAFQIDSVGQVLKQLGQHERPTPDMLLKAVWRLHVLRQAMVQASSS